MNRFPILIALLAGIASAEPNMTPVPTPPAPVVTLGTTAEAPIKMTGELTALSGALWEVQIQVAASKKPAQIFVTINSPGGLAAPGFQIIRAMREAAAHGSPVVCRVEGSAISMAAFILEAGCARRRITPSSLIMFHEIYFSGFPPAPEPNRIRRQDFQHWANELEDDNMKAAVLCAPRLQITAAQMYQWMIDHDRYIGAPEALAMGAVDEVVP